MLIYRKLYTVIYRLQIKLTSEKISSSVIIFIPFSLFFLACAIVEEFIYEFLTKNNSKFLSIIWDNKNGESGKPYDFRVFENEKEKFIDVKGTPSGSKNIVLPFTK